VKTAQRSLPAGYNGAVGGDRVKDSRARFIPIGLLLALNGVPALSQTKPLSIQVGGHEVYLGMPVAQVVSDLSAENFRVQAEAADAKLPLRAWWIWGPPAGDWAYTFAVIYARSNTVVGVDHRTSEVETTHDVFNALFGAASKLSQQGRNPCNIGPRSNYLSNGNVAGVQLDCGGFHIELTRTEFTDDKGKLITTYEVWESIGTVRTTTIR